MAENRRAVASWVLYDWANSAFATTVMAGFFPIFFKDYWCEGVASTVSTFRLGVGNGAAGLLVALSAPVLGAMADRGGVRKRFLLLFAALGIAMTTGLFFVARGAWQAAVVVYLLAVIGFAGANSFYDSLLVTVTDEARFDIVSAIGFAAGYLGGGLLFALNVWMVSHPTSFGLRDTAQAIRLSFLSVAVWWALFSIPVALFVRDGADAGGARSGIAIVAGLRQLGCTLRQIRQFKAVALFLGAYWFYIDGVNTIVKMAVDYGMSLGLGAQSLVKALLLTQFVGFPAAIVYGKIGEKLGARRGLLLGIGAYALATLWAFRLSAVWEFYALAVVIGLVQGGVQSLSRSMYAGLVPADRAAEFFGFYNMLGKFATFLGPLLMGVTGWITGNPRLGVLSLMLLFGIGGILLSLVEAGGCNADTDA